MKKIKKNNLTLMPGRDIRMEPLVGDWPLTMQIRYVAKMLEYDQVSNHSCTHPFSVKICERVSQFFLRAPFRKINRLKSEKYKE